MAPQRSRADRNHNPAAFTTAIAAQAGLEQGIDYAIGDEFQDRGKTFNTARLLGDPVALTLKVLDKIGFFTAQYQPRWVYIAIPETLWKTFSDHQRLLIPV